MQYRFGPYVLDVATRELRRDGERVVTEPRAFELLVYLAEHRDRAVSKEELLNVLWPRQIVTETALSRSVMKARRAVGDDAERQSVIRTLHGHGYRFVAALEADAHAGASPGADTIDATATAGPAGTLPEAVAAAPASRARRLQLPRVAVLVPVLAVIGLIAAGAWLLWRDDPVPPAGLVAVLPVIDRTEDAELRWVRVGMMSLLARMLEESGLEIVPENRVLEAVADLPLSAPPDGPAFERIRARTGAATVLHAALDPQPGLYRLTAVLTHAGGRQTRRMIVGKAPATLAADLAKVVAGLLHGAPVPDEDRFSKVSADPFVNEMYARALDLELQGELAQARDMFRLASTQEPELFWLRYEIAVCTRDLREWEEATAQFAVLYEEAISGADARALIVTLNSRGILHLNRSDYPRAEADFREAFAVAEERGSANDRSTVLTNLGLVAAHQGRTSAARESYEKALAELEAAERPPTGFLLNNYAGLLMNAGDLAMARTYAERAVELFRLHGQRRYEAPALNRVARILRRQGDFEAALDHHEQALAIYRELGDTRGELVVQNALTDVYRERGDLSRALANADEVLDRARGEDDVLVLADAHMALASVLSEFGRAAEALTHYEEAERLFVNLGDAAGIEGARTGIALAALDAGDLDRAAAQANALLSAAIATAEERPEARARWLVGRVAEGRGDPDVAAEAYGAALAYARDGDDREFLLQSAASLAELELKAGRIDEAAALAEELRAVAATEPDFLRLDARLALARGDAERARDIVATLRRRAGEAWQARDDALLAELGDPVRP